MYFYPKTPAFLKSVKPELQHPKSRIFLVSWKLAVFANYKIYEVFYLWDRDFEEQRSK